MAAWRWPRARTPRWFETIRCIAGSRRCSSGLRTARRAAGGTRSRRTRDAAADLFWCSPDCVTSGASRDELTLTPSPSPAGRGERDSAGEGRMSCISVISIIGERTMPETVHEMVVDHARRLHERVADRRADESEAACLQRLRHRIGLSRARRHVAGTAPAIDLRRAADKAPHQIVEASVFALRLDHGACIADRAFDLQPVADD